MSYAEIMAAEMVAAVREHVKGAVAPLLSEIAALRADLVTAQLGLITALQIADENAKALAELPKPKDGKDGTDGKSVDLEALGLQIEARVDAQVAKSIAKIPKAKDGIDGKNGEKGNDGEDGINGAKGLDGKDGIDGKNGEKGNDGEDGINGAKGLDGKDGIDARDGKDGKDGRDALDLEIESEIDTSRSYQRGTWACYRGGLIKSFRNTDPITDGIEKAGWEVMLEGEADFGIELGDDLRTFAIGTEFTSGKSVVKSFTLPVVIYRGVFQRGKDYSRGDEVTWGNQQFIALKDTKEEPLSIGSVDWQLSTKKGRDGKDGKDGACGAKGDEGKRGRDLTHMAPNGEKYA